MNAGTSFLDATDADWDRVLAINLRAVFQACQVFGRHMVKAGGGAIVNIGSVTSHLPLSRVFAYSASKAGVLNLTRNVAQEFGPLGVRVNAICPGFFPAEQNRKLLDQKRIDNIMHDTPMRRLFAHRRRLESAGAARRALYRRDDRQRGRRLADASDDGCAGSCPIWPVAIRRHRRAISAAIPAASPKPTR